LKKKFKKLKQGKQKQKKGSKIWQIYNKKLKDSNVFSFVSNRKRASPPKQGKGQG
jgi:hypothetical protein